MINLRGIYSLNQGCEIYSQRLAPIGTNQFTIIYFWLGELKKFSDCHMRKLMQWFQISRLKKHRQITYIQTNILLKSTVSYSTVI